MQLQMFGKRHLFELFYFKNVHRHYSTLLYFDIYWFDKKNICTLFFASDFFLQIAIYLQDRQIHFLF